MRQLDWNDVYHRFPAFRTPFKWSNTHYNEATGTQDWPIGARVGDHWAYRNEHELSGLVDAIHVVTKAENDDVVLKPIAQVEFDVNTTLYFLHEKERGISFHMGQVSWGFKIGNGTYRREHPSGKHWVNDFPLWKVKEDGTVEPTLGIPLPVTYVHTHIGMMLGIDLHVRTGPAIILHTGKVLPMRGENLRFLLEGKFIEIIDEKTEVNNLPNQS